MQNDKITEWLFANQFSSVMNKTKWIELANEMTSNPDFYPKVRIKYIDDDQASQSFAHLDWEWVKFGDARVIEWMDIDPMQKNYVGRLVDDTTVDFSSWVRAALLKHLIPFFEMDGLFRIRGYLKPNE